MEVGTGDDQYPMHLSISYSGVAERREGTVKGAPTTDVRGGNRK